MAMNLTDFLEKRKYILVIVSVILFTLIIGNNFIYQVQKKKMSYLKKEIREEEVKNRLIREIVLLNEKVSFYKKRLPAQRDVSWLIRKIAQLAKDTGVRIISLQPKARDRQVGYVRIPLEIKLNSSYHELGRFLSNIESSPEFIRIDSLQLISTGSSEQISEIEEEKSESGAAYKYRSPTANLIASTVYLEE